METLMSHIAAALAGAVVTGGFLLLRADWMGSKAASTAEKRLNIRIDKLEEKFASDVHEIREMLHDLLMRMQKGAG